MTRIQCLLFVILLAFTPENGTRDGTGKQRFSCSSFAEAAVMNTGIAEPRALTDGKGTDTANDASKEESRRRYQDAMAAFQRKVSLLLASIRDVVLYLIRLVSCLALLRIVWHIRRHGRSTNAAGG